MCRELGDARQVLLRRISLMQLTREKDCRTASVPQLQGVQGLEEEGFRRVVHVADSAAYLTGVNTGWTSPPLEFPLR
jgi:hypothetical protein